VEPQHGQVQLGRLQRQSEERDRQPAGLAPQLEHGAYGCRPAQTWSSCSWFPHPLPVPAASVRGLNGTPPTPAVPSDDGPTRIAPVGSVGPAEDAVLLALATGSASGHRLPGSLRIPVIAKAGLASSLRNSPQRGQGRERVTLDGRTQDMLP
jgi:hypothetical protein